MKKARYQFVKGRPKPHKISYYREDGSRAAKFFEQQGEALLFQAKLNEVSCSELPDNLDFSVDDRIIFAQIKSECEKFEAELFDALGCVRSFLPKYLRLDVSGQAWEVAQKAYFADLLKRGARSSSLAFYKSQIGKFARMENPENVKDISVEKAQKYLASVASPEHAKRALRAFFTFCISQKWIDKNPFTDAKTPRILKEVAPTPVLSVCDTKQFFANLPADWRPMAAIMAFAGVRPAEIISSDCSPVLLCGDIDFKARRITIRAEVSKVRRLRVLAGLPANLWAWIEPLRSCPASMAVAPASYEVWRRVKSNTGVELPKDVLRHSFASYAYHYLGAEAAVEILGHIGGFAVFAKHYKGLATDEDSKAYFSIMPPKKAAKKAVKNRP